MTAIHQFVEECRAGTLERCIGKMDSGWVVLGDPQVRPGYCLLYPDPIVATLNDLVGRDRLHFLEDMAKLGDAVLEVTGAARINYEILGNLEPALHAHVVPRFEDEPLEVRTKPIWLDNWEAARRFDLAIDLDFMEKIRAALGNELDSWKG